MNILVLSDTHGSLDRAEEMFQRITKSFPVDHIIHCGDHYKDALQLSKKLGVPVTAAHGNCDGQRTREILLLETPAGKIGVTHGHADKVDYTLQNITYTAKEYGCKAICFGHTHVPVNEMANGIRLLNPGSLTNPRGGSKPSCALIIATEKFLAATLMEY